MTEEEYELLEKEIRGSIPINIDQLNINVSVSKTQNTIEKTDKQQKISVEFLSRFLVNNF